MDFPEVKTLCEQLREVIETGPGKNDLALAEAEGLVSVLQDAVPWIGPADKLVTVKNWLAVWFSQRLWRKYGDAGEICLQSLLNDITVVEQYWERKPAQQASASRSSQRPTH